LREEEQNGWQEPLMAISSPGILFPAAHNSLALSVLFCTVVCDAEGGQILLFDPQNEKLCKIAKERLRQLTLPGCDI
jgi:hypothetical protein